MFDSVIRFSYLQKMVEWYIGSQKNWQITTNKRGRFFKQYLDTEIWNALEETFAGADIEENWKALFSMAAIFRELTVAIANKLHYIYPESMGTEITDYLKQIRVS